MDACWSTPAWKAGRTPATQSARTYAEQSGTIVEPANDITTPSMSPDGRWECARKDIHGWGGDSCDFLVRRTETTTTTNTEEQTHGKWITLSELPVRGAWVLDGCNNLADGRVDGFDECEWFDIDTFTRRPDWDAVKQENLSIFSIPLDLDTRISAVLRVSANYESDEFGWDRFVELPGASDDTSVAESLCAFRVWWVPPVPLALPLGLVSRWCTLASEPDCELYPAGVLQGKGSFGEAVLRVCLRHSIPRDVTWVIWCLTVTVHGDWMKRQSRKRS
jgi:hypothetical protein